MSTSSQPKIKVWPPAAGAKEGKYPKGFSNSCLNPDCPSNHSSEINFEVSGSSWDVDGNTVTQEVTCLVCEAYWTDIYELKCYCNLKVPA